MPRTIEQLRRQAENFNSMDIAFKPIFNSIEKDLKIQGKENWQEVINGKIESLNTELNVIDGEINVVNGKIGEIYTKNAGIGSRMAIKSRILSERYQDNLNQLDDEINPDHNQVLESINLYNNNVKASEDYKKWKKENIDKPKAPLDKEKNDLMEIYVALNTKIENHRRYINERNNRGVFFQENFEQVDQIKTSYKDLKKAYESHNWLAQIFAHILPAWMLQASQDLDDLNEGKQLLLDTGFTENDINTLDREAINEMEEANNAPQQIVINNVPENENQGNDINEQDLNKSVDSEELIGEIKENVNLNKRNDMDQSEILYDLTNNIQNNMEESFSSENKNYENNEKNQENSNLSNEESKENIINLD